jgi:NAD(P)-dependent dehydrogenase (short-subunit alcohol dehydrogenase family)
MVPQKSGHILMMGSASGHSARPDRTLYCGTKGAMELFTKSLAMELGPYGIQVNCIAPGLVATGRTANRMENDPERYKERAKGIALGRLGTAKSIAAATVFLVSSENDFMSGAVISIDGAPMSG